MSEPTLAEVLEMLQAMNAKITTIETEMAKKEKAETSSGGGDHYRYEGGHGHEFHPKPKKWDFPRYDGTTDPMLFLNKCDAYFPNTEPRGMTRCALPPTISTTWHSCGSRRSRRMTAHPTGRTSRSC
jgi:hypothetical protein